MNLHIPKWSPDIFLNIQRTIATVKTHWIEKILYTMGKFVKRKCLKGVHMGFPLSSFNKGSKLSHIFREWKGIGPYKK
jgi:hypothetical protein